MEFFSWGTFLALFLLVVPLLFLQRFLQREIQAVFLLVTRQPEISTALYSLIFLPGVVLHELSHFLMATILRVRTGRFSIIPKKLEGGRIQLGYVETATTDFFRDALIGAAPLLAGGIFVAYIGSSRLGINVIWEAIRHGQMSAINMGIKTVAGQPDFWLWFYMLFTISNTMLPSASDRRAWLPVLLVIGFLIGLVILVGVGPWLLSRFGSTFASAMDTISMVLGITVLMDLVLVPPIYFVRRLVSRILGLRIV